MHLRRGTITAIIAFPPFQFFAFDGCDHLDDRLRIRQDVEHVFVQDADTTRGDCAHGEFFVTGTPSLRTTQTSSGTRTRCATSNATGTPPRGRARTMTSSRPA